MVKFSGKNLISDSRFINPLSLLKKERLAGLGFRSFLARPLIVLSLISFNDLIFAGLSREKAGALIKHKDINDIARQRNWVFRFLSSFIYTSII